MERRGSQKQKFISQLGKFRLATMSVKRRSSQKSFDMQDRNCGVIRTLTYRIWNNNCLRAQFKLKNDAVLLWWGEKRVWSQLYGGRPDNKKSIGLPANIKPFGYTNYPRHHPSAPSSHLCPNKHRRGQRQFP